MKIRSIATVLITGVLSVATIAYVAPALADDEETSLDNMPTLAENNVQPQSGADATDAPNNPTDNKSMNTNDQPTPDTATGDDDY